MLQMRMTEILGGPIQIRDRNVITLPKEVRNVLGVSVGDWLGFELHDGVICLHRVIPHRMRNNIVGGENDERDGQKG